MNLGTKINLILVIVTAVVLTTAFWIIVSIESTTAKNQVLNDADTAIGMFKEEIERMFKRVHDEQDHLQRTIDELSRIEGVIYINVADMSGGVIAATDHKIIGTKEDERDAELIKQIQKTGETLDTRNDEGSFFELERRIPIRRTYGDATSVVINVIEVEVTTNSKSAYDIAQAQKLLKAISSSVEQSARSIIVAREEGVDSIKKVTSTITRLGKVTGEEEYGFFHDLIIFDKRLSVVANTESTVTGMENDPQEYRQYREDVLSGKYTERYYTREHNGMDMIVRVIPLAFDSGAQSEKIGLMEVHILESAYRDRVNALKFRMFGIGVIFTSVLVVVLAVFLRREVVEPITRYSRIAQRVADGDLSQTIESTGDDEIGNFGDVFNSMVKNLREFDRLKSDFISVAAHQLRTPLSGVKWVLKLLLDGDVGPVTEDQHAMLKRGFEANEKMIQLVNDLLNVSRIENGKFGYKIEKNNFNRILALLVENATLPAQARQINVVLQKHAEIPEFYFDPEKILIALQNLVDNAIKYTLPGGKVTIKTEQQGDYLQVKVSDTGVGIPKADMSKLFSKFFRATNVIHLQTDGSGLGLFIVKSIIMRHGGQVWVDSEEGKGTTFTVVIPLIAELLPKDEDAKTPKVDAPANEV